jgi:hypothetical protein
MKTALAFALLTLVVAAAAPAAPAAGPRDPSLAAPARPPWALPAQVFVDAPVVTSAE